MTRLLAGLLVPLLAAGLVAFVTPAPAEAAAPLAHRATLRGVIVKVDASKHAFLLHTVSGKDVPVAVTKKTKLFVDGAPATFADLAAGQKAKVRGRKAPKKPFFVARRVRAKS